MKEMEENDCVVVSSAEELLNALKIEAPNILITKEYKETFLENTSLPFPETSFFSIETADGGDEGIGDPLFHVMNWLSKDSKLQKQINKKIQKYYYKEYGEDFLLNLRPVIRNQHKY